MARYALRYYYDLIRSPHFKQRYDYSMGTFDSDFGINEDEKSYREEGDENIPLVLFPTTNQIDPRGTLDALINHGSVNRVIKARAAVAIGLQLELQYRHNNEVDEAAKYYRHALSLAPALPIARTSLTRLYHNRCSDTGVIQYNHCMAEAHAASSASAKADAYLHFIKQFNLEKFIDFLLNDKTLECLSKRGILLDLLTDPRQYCTPEQFKAALVGKNDENGNSWLQVLENNLLEQIQYNAKTASKTVTTEAKDCFTDYYRNIKQSKAKALDALSAALIPPTQAAAGHADLKDEKGVQISLNVTQQILNAVNNTTSNHPLALDGGSWKSSRFWSTPTGNRTGDVFAGALLALKRLGLNANEPQQQLTNPMLQTIMTAKPS